jgi:hypothetical protein
VVLMVPLIGAKRFCIGGSTGAERRRRKGAHRRCGPAVLVEETGIGSLDELRWIVGCCSCFGSRMGSGDGGCRR